VDRREQAREARVLGDLLSAALRRGAVDSRGARHRHAGMPAELAGRMRELVSAADLSPERRTAGVGIGSGASAHSPPGERIQRIWGVTERNK